ncbi:Uncharacterized protein XB16_0207 [Leptospira santarosai]|uniref:Integrase core domain protein n=1 Tax=Leptospira santarosai TaxID=28183 RepID=A0A2P1QNT0_9LEPT|nr:Uncharacterized protein XB16_0207 [Leptospira santarosai]
MVVSQPEFSIPSGRVIRILNEAVEVYGLPKQIVVDNGPEFYDPQIGFPHEIAVLRTAFNEKFVLNLPNAGTLSGIEWKLFQKPTYDKCYKRRSNVFSHGFNTLEGSLFVMNIIDFNFDGFIAFGYVMLLLGYF